MQILGSIPDEAVTNMVRGAGIYLDTADPDGHPFGMPISIAEAMACGSVVIARRMPDIEGYLLGAGGTYRTVDEAAGMVNETLTWDGATWENSWRTAKESSKRYQDVAVLPALIQDWREIAGKA